MLSSLCLHEEQRHAHNQKATRIIYRMHRLTTLHLLFVGVMCFAYYNRPQSVVAYVMAGEIGWYIAQILLKIWERYEHEKQAPGDFSFQLDFQVGFLFLVPLPELQAENVCILISPLTQEKQENFVLFQTKLPYRCPRVQLIQWS
jgi:hypothetical protein